MLLMAALLFSSNALGAEIISLSDVSRLHADNTEGGSVKKVLAVGNSVNVPIEFSITSKGNGGFSLPGLF